MQTIVISLGGSMINPGKINLKFLKALKEVIYQHSKENKIVIVTGGGKTARDYISALEGKTRLEKDLIGIDCTRLNARLIASYLGANKTIPIKLKEVKPLLKKHRIVICGGLEPGKTSDGTTAEIARDVKADILINMTNVKGLFTKDPRKYKTAKFINRISHKAFKEELKRIKEKPGQHFVLDKVAADICRKDKRQIIILKGIKNLDNLLRNKKFEGTIIS